MPSSVEIGWPSCGPCNVVPQFLDILGGSGHRYLFWAKSQSDINGEARLSPIHEEVGVEACGGILGTVVTMCQHSNIALPVRLAFWRQCLKHINQDGVEPLTLTIPLGVICTGSEFLDPSYFTKVSYELTLKIALLV